MIIYLMYYSVIYAYDENSMPDSPNEIKPTDIILYFFLSIALFCVFFIFALLVACLKNQLNYRRSRKRSKRYYAPRPYLIGDSGYDTTDARTYAPSFV